MAAAAPKQEVDAVVVHPLVLLSVTDHFYREAKDSKQVRVVGVLLGETFKGRLDIVNSFALPFEEDAKDPSIFFLDHDYLESMYAMFRKIAAKERIVGFYSTGPKIRPADLKLDELFRKYCPKPLMVIVDVRPECDGIPIQVYSSVEEVRDGAEAVRTFTHVRAEIGAYEAEEVGVEHLLRDINDPSVSALGSAIRAKVMGLEGLLLRLDEMAAYLSAVAGGQLPPNRDILYAIQSTLALLPDTGVEELREALLEASNDTHLALYAASTVRAVTGECPLPSPHPPARTSPPPPLQRCTTSSSTRPPSGRGRRPRRRRSGWRQRRRRRRRRRRTRRRRRGRRRRSARRGQGLGARERRRNNTNAVELRAPSRVCPLLGRRGRICDAWEAKAKFAHFSSAQPAFVSLGQAYLKSATALRSSRLLQGEELKKEERVFRKAVYSAAGTISVQAGTSLCARACPPACLQPPRHGHNSPHS